MDPPGPLETVDRRQVFGQPKWFRRCCVSPRGVADDRESRSDSQATRLVRVAHHHPSDFPGWHR
jgi:hypothetical protein